MQDGSYDIDDLKTKAHDFGLDTGHLDDFTDDEIREHFNGVGPEKWPEWLRRRLSKTYSAFMPIILVHDMDYAAGGTEEDRYNADKRAFDNAEKILATMPLGRQLLYRMQIGPTKHIMANVGKRAFNYKSAAYMSGFISQLKKCLSAS